eukprot:11028558-Karenia_brevis.AAC.1
MPASFWALKCTACLYQRARATVCHGPLFWPVLEIRRGAYKRVSKDRTTIAQALEATCSDADLRDTHLVHLLPWQLH